jgi:hypothetical protein
LFRGEQACQAGKINPAESQRKDGSPGDPGKLQVSEHICQGELGSAVIEDLEGQQGAYNDDAPGHATPNGNALEHRADSTIVPKIGIHDNLQLLIEWTEQIFYFARV